MSSYKDTLNLPKTDFPMKAGLTTREPEMLARWEEAGLYGKIQEKRKDAPLFVLHDGPPFANGDVHMGTALNKVLKDFIVKSRTMLGFRAPFVPGWDCHGLPIEFKVVKESAGLSPVEVRRKSEEYARKFIDIQRRQFRRLGVFGDWNNPYLTLDPGYEAEIIRSFGRFVEKGRRVVTITEKMPETWTNLVEAKGHGVIDGEVLTRSEEADEFLLMGLRLAEGIDLSRYEQYAGRPLSSSRLSILQEEGLVAPVGNSRLRATPAGMIVLDAVVADLAR